MPGCVGWDSPALAADGPTLAVGVLPSLPKDRLPPPPLQEIAPFLRVLGSYPMDTELGRQG